MYGFANLLIEAWVQCLRWENFWGLFYFVMLFIEVLTMNAIFLTPKFYFGCGAGFSKDYCVMCERIISVKLASGSFAKTGFALESYCHLRNEICLLSEVLLRFGITFQNRATQYQKLGKEVSLF
jgi:hypothetical protein